MPFIAIIIATALLPVLSNRLAGQDSRAGTGPASRPSPKAGEPFVPAGRWTLGAIKEDPAGFVAYAISRLRESMTSAESDEYVLRRAAKKLDRFRQENGEKLASNGAALSAFKEIFEAPGREWPLPVAGRVYDETAFLKEVDRLLEERSLLAATGDRIALAAEDVDRDVRFLATQIQIDRAILDTLEASKPLLAKPLSSTLERIMETAHERLSTVPDARPDWRSFSEATSRKSRLTVAEFLNQKPESRK